MLTRAIAKLPFPGRAAGALPILAGATAIGAVVLLCALLLAKPTPVHIGVAAAIVLLPVAAYVALAHPMLFPYGLYVLLVPLDNLLAVSSSGTLTKLLGMVSGLVLVFWCLRMRRIELPPRSVYALVALLCWCFLSVAWAPSQTDSMEWVRQYVSLGLLYIALSVTPISRSDFRWLLAFTVIGGLVTAAIGAHQFYSNPLVRADGLAVRRLIIHAGNASIDPNAMSDSLLLPIAVLAMGVLRTRWITLKLLGLAGLGFMAATIALSGSREGLVGLIVVIGYLGWRTRYRIQIAILAAATLATSLALHTTLWTRLSDAISTGGAGRVAIWRVGLDAFEHNWLLGYGLGSFPSVYDRFYLHVYQAYTNGWTSPPHNLLIQVGVELGVVGIVLVGWFIVTTFTGLRGIGSDSAFHDYRIMMEAALLGLFVVSMFIGLFTDKYAWLVFTLAAQVRLLGIQEARERRAAALSEADS